MLVKDKFNIDDYEINLLLDSRTHYQRSNRKTSTGLAYYYTRSIIRYMTRLIFAIGWYKLQDFATNSVNKNIYVTLFKDPKEKNGKDSIEPGTFAYLLNKSAKEINMYQTVKAEIDILYELGDVRNYNAHEINMVNFSEFYSKSDAVFSHFGNYFANKHCYYIIPREYINESDVLCAKLKTNDTYPEEILLPSNLFKWSKTGNRLFYAVMDMNTSEVEYYSLSPFIEIPLFIDAARPRFRTYDRLQNHGYGNKCDSLLFYKAEVEVEEKDGAFGPELFPHFKITTADYTPSALFSSPDIKDESSWVPSLNNDVFINISSYPGFKDITNNKYRYCAEICPIRDNVIQFCKDNKKQVVQINGNGGVGKTALALSVLSELFTSKTEYFYSNLIFISAKKSYYSRKPLKYQLQDIEKEADIHSYTELIEKLAHLLEITFSENADITAEEIIKQMNSGIFSLGVEKKFLLVIDDLDSLDAREQRLIVEFIYKLDSRAFKTIITTRNIAENSPVSYQISELSVDQSIRFAKWYAENILSIPSWNGWNRKEVAIGWIKKCGEGNPLTIQMLLLLVKGGLEKIYEASDTKRERITYLYSTVRNLLNREEKQVFEICCQLYRAIPGEKANQDMLLAVPKYLSAACGINHEIFEKAIHKLNQLKLIIRSNNKLQFRIYSTFILSENIVEAENSTPRMFKLVWKSVRETSDCWLRIDNVEKQVAHFVFSIERENEFDIVAARSILERILEDPHIYETLKSEIKAWLNKHSIYNTINKENSIQNEMANRLIQSIETRWESLKEIISAGDENLSEEQVLSDEIHKLQELLDSSNNSSVAQRLFAVRKEIKEYDDL